MTLYNPSYSHEEGEYQINPNQNRSTGQVIADCFRDFFTAWLTESSLKLWVRVWLAFLMTGVMLPLAFLPHPFAITNLVAMNVILVLNGKELARVRGLNKNMGWPHIVAWTPVMVVNILCLTTDTIGSDGKVTWDTDEDPYDKARYVAIIFNTVMLGISLVFDVVDTVMYFGYGKTDIERSKWTTDQLVKVENTEATKNSGLMPA